MALVKSIAGNEICDAVARNAQVGGRNLLRYTDFKDASKWNKNNGATISNGIGTISANSGKQVELYRKDAVSGKAGDKFTFSVNVLTNTLSGGDGFKFYVWCVGKKSDGSAYNTWPIGDKLSTNFTGVYSYTWTIPSGVTITKLGIDMDAYNCTSGTATVNHYKIERGDKATDWTPALEDTLTMTDDNNGNVTISIL